MNEKSGTYWYNYKTQEYETLFDVPEDFTDYIPQIPAAQSLYRLYIQHMHWTPMDAAIKVLKAYIPQEKIP